MGGGVGVGGGGELTVQCIKSRVRLVDKRQRRREGRRGREDRKDGVRLPGND